MFFKTDLIKSVTLHAYCWWGQNELPSPLRRPSCLGHPLSGPRDMRRWPNCRGPLYFASSSPPARRIWHRLYHRPGLRPAHFYSNWGWLSWTSPDPRCPRSKYPPESPVFQPFSSCTPPRESWRCPDCKPRPRTGSAYTIYPPLNFIQIYHFVPTSLSLSFCLSLIYNYP